jgi:tRNA(fMet)-specific endonuclease VapC
MILDTNALSAWWDNEPALIKILADSSRVFVPTPALAEIRYGILQSRKREEMERWMAQALASTTILPIEDPTTFHYATLRLHLKRAGTPIPMNDLWIAAIALQHGLPIVSRDSRFDHVPELRRVSW